MSSALSGQVMETGPSDEKDRRRWKLSPTHGEALHLLRLTFETESLLSTGSSDKVTLKRRPRRRDREGSTGPEDVQATALLRDANGLPTISGASIQGALRALAGEDEVLSSLVKSLFGHAQEGQERTYAARMHVGFACVHDAGDKAVVGLQAPSADPLLAYFRQDAPTRRDHVALDPRHVVDELKKFERIAIPIGTRFSLEISLWGQADDDSLSIDRATLECLAALFGSDSFRLGGGSTRGYGRIRVIRASYERPDLGDSEALRTLRLEAPSKPLLEDISSQLIGSVGSEVRVDLILRPIGFWRIGGQSGALTNRTNGIRRHDGERPKLSEAPNARELDYNLGQRDERDVMTALRDDRIIWNGGKGAISRAAERQSWTRMNDVPFPVPGSSVRGALVHRALFHANRLARRMIDADAPSIAVELDHLATYAERHGEGLRALLGSGKERRPGGRRGLGRSDDPAMGLAASFRVDDGEASGVEFVQAIDHNSIDRFTGGVRNKILFTEEVLWRGEIRIGLSIAPPPRTPGFEPSGDDIAGWPQEDARALLLAIADLCSGHMAIGARSLGYCEGQLTNWRGPGAEHWQRLWGSTAQSVGARTNV